MRGRWWSSAICLAVAALTPACGGGADAARRVETARSWGATARMLGEEWAARHLPDTYTRQALERASAELAHQHRSLERAPGPGGAPAGVAALAEQVGRLRDRVRAGDHAGARAVAGELGRHLEALVRPTGPPS